MPNQRVRTWSRAGPWLPRSSGTGLPRFLACDPRPLDGLAAVEEGGRRDSRQQLVDLERRQVVVEAVAVAHDRRVLAGAKALDRLTAEEAVAGDLAVLAHADPVLEVLEDLVRAGELAAQVVADVEVVLADRLEVEERVEGGDPLDAAGGGSGARGDA